jgi:hypothetical protein
VWEGVYQTDAVAVKVFSQGVSQSAVARDALVETVAELCKVKHDNLAAFRCVRYPYTVPCCTFCIALPR